ncbi:MAG: thioredoxin domain-containing protein [Candidatus Jorgensenbacteria bacterium]
MKNNGLKFKIILAIFVVILIFAFLFLNSRGTGKYSDEALNAFAQCLAAKNVTMYGAYWCSHCQNQKAMFGSSFKHVPYVECTTEPQKCLAAKVEGYPTWVLADGTQLAGERPLETLAAASGCALPQQ